MVANPSEEPKPYFLGPSSRILKSWWSSICFEREFLSLWLRIHHLIFKILECGGVRYGFSDSAKHFELFGIFWLVGTTKETNLVLKNNMSWFLRRFWDLFKFPFGLPPKRNMQHVQVAVTVMSYKNYTSSHLFKGLWKVVGHYISLLWEKIPCSLPFQLFKILEGGGLYIGIGRKKI